MKTMSFLFTVCVLSFAGPAWAQPNYLIRIDRTDQITIDQIKQTEIQVWAKTATYWIAGASETDLKLASEAGIAYRVLDGEAQIGEHYFVWPKPWERIDSRLSEIEARSRVLAVYDNVAIVKGNPRQIEQLAFSGFSLRKIHKRALRLERRAEIASYLQTLSRGYDPLIDSMVNKVDQAQLLSWIDDLTGEDTTLIGGVEDSIKTRYSYSDGIFKAAHYMKERFEEMGLSAEFDTFQIVGLEQYLVDVACSPDGQKAWSVSYSGGMIKTLNGGDLWSLVEGTGYLELHDVCRVDDDTLWAVGDDGIIIRSTDGGDTWEDRSKPEFALLDFKRSYFEDGQNGWIVGDDKILYTSDGGANWTQQVQLAGETFFGVDFVDPYRGWTVGEGGTILNTTDRGTNWNAQTSGTTTRLRQVDFVDLLNGWAVGDDGWAVYTTDGGTNWTRKTLPTPYHLNDIVFVDSLHGWMVGLDGSIFYTSDLGANWVFQSSNVLYLFGVDFADTLTGWSTGYEQIIKTTDGGQNWFSQYQNIELLDLLNVVATIDGLGYPGREFLITGHYDAVSEDPFNWTPGADDNASGAVSLLAAASILKDYDLANTVKFVAFSGEEQGLLGSAAYAEEAYNRGDTILGVLNFDMIAYDGNGDDTIEVHCDLPAENQALGDLLIGAIVEYGLSLAPQKLIEDASWSSDHASFWDYDFPAISGGEDHQDFNPYYHSTDDRVSVFDTAYYVDFTKAAVAGIAILGNPFVLGDVNEDHIINIGDVVFLINYLYRSGPAPDPVAAGDVNCDGTVDLGDVVYLISYLYKGGPPPDC